MMSSWVWNGPAVNYPYLPYYENTPIAYNGASIDYAFSTTTQNYDSNGNYTELQSYFNVYYAGQTYEWCCKTRFHMNGTYYFESTSYKKNKINNTIYSLFVLITIELLH